MASSAADSPSSQAPADPPLPAMQPPVNGSATVKAVKESLDMVARLDALKNMSVFVSPILCALPAVFSTVIVWVGNLFGITIGLAGDFVSLLLLTLPLTVAVAVIVHMIRTKAIEGPYGMLFALVIALAGSAWLSTKLGVGQTIDLNKAWIEAWGEHHLGQPGSGKGLIVVVVYAIGGMLVQYHHLYGTGPFVLSLACGFLAGLMTSE